MCVCVCDIMCWDFYGTSLVAVCIHFTSIVNQYDLMCFVINY